MPYTSFHFVLKFPVLSILWLAWLAPAALGQMPFFSEGAVFSPYNKISLTISDEQTVNSTIDNGVQVEQTENDFQGLRSTAVLGAGPLRLGGLLSRSVSTTSTSLFLEETVQTEKEAYLALGIPFWEGRGFLAYMAKHQDNLVDTTNLSTRTQFGTRVPIQHGLMLGTPFLNFGYFKADAQVSLDQTDGGAPVLDEIYDFGYSFYYLAFKAGRPDRPLIEINLFHFEVPSVPGNLVNLNNSFAASREIAFALGPARLRFQRAEVHYDFTPLYMFQEKIRETSLGIPLSDKIVLTISQQRTEGLEQFYSGGLPAKSRTDQRINKVSLELSF